MDDSRVLDTLVTTLYEENEVGHGDHWRIFFDDLEELGRVLPLIGREATPILTCADDENTSPLPLPADEPTGELVVWPNAERGMIQLHRRDEQTGQMVIDSAYPWLADGVVHMAKVQGMRLWPGRLEAHIDAKIGDGKAVTFFDPLFAKNRVFYREGGFYPMVFAGWAYEVCLFGEHLRADGENPLSLSPDTIPFKLVNDGNAPDDYAFIGLVKDAKTVRFFDFPVLLLRVAVGHFVLPFEESLEIDLVVTDSALGLSRAPEIDDVIFGRLWLTGYLKKPNTEIFKGEAS